MRSEDRRARAQALLVTYETSCEAAEEEDVTRAEQAWGRILPFLEESSASDEARGSNEVTLNAAAAGALDSDDEGIRVRRPGAASWTRPTPEEKAELKKHDQDVKKEESWQQEADLHSYNVYQAGVTRDWGDWVMRSALQGTEDRLRKRVKVELSLRTGGDCGCDAGGRAGDTPVGHDGAGVGGRARWGE